MKKMFSILIASLFFTALSYGGYQAIILTFADEIDSQTQSWEFSFDIINTGSEAIEKLTIWFDYANYNGFQVTTESQPAASWTQIIIPPEDFTRDGAGFDITNTSSPLAAGDSISGFKVSFNYLGQETPSQYGHTFEIVNPTTFDTQYTSQTIPEPATLSLLALGFAGLGMKKRKNA